MSATSRPILRRLAGRAATLGKRALAVEDAAHLDYWQGREAREARAVIEARRPDRALDVTTLRRIRDYAIDVLGSPRFAPWLETYTAYRGEFLEGWMPDNYFLRIVLPTLPGFQEGFDRKTLTRRLMLGTDLLPDRASFVNGTWLDRSGEPISEADALELIFEEGDRAVLKHDVSKRGESVVVIRKNDFHPAEHAARGNFVVQAYIRQHPILDAYAPSSVATLRVTTSKHGGTPARLRCAYLRLGRSDKDIVTSLSAVRVPVAVDGALARDGSLADWTPVTAHPDSGQPFAGVAIPGFLDAVPKVLALHDRIPHVAHIGWDIAIDAEERPLLMEWNPNHAAIKFSEAANGPHFRDLGWERLARR